MGAKNVYRTQKNHKKKYDDIQVYCSHRFELKQKKCIRRQKYFDH